MARKRHSDEDILRLLWEIEVNLHDGMGVVSACRKAGVSVVALYLRVRTIRMPFCFINRPTRRCPTAKPSSFSSSVMRGRP